MVATTPKPRNIAEYIGGFPPETQMLLEQMRMAIHVAAPDAIEKISYSIPTFALNGNLVHFAAYKNHLGFYALPTGHSEFANELSKYKIGKGSVQFPLNQPLPFDLINRMVKFRVMENLKQGKK